MFLLFIYFFLSSTLLFLCLAIVTLGKGLIDRGARNRLDTILYRCPLLECVLWFLDVVHSIGDFILQCYARVDMKYSYTRL